MSSDLTRYLGTLQGVLIPAGRDAPPDAEALGLGQYAVVFGSDLPGRTAELVDGDQMVVTQTLQDGVGSRVRFLYSLDLRSGLPAGWEWHERVIVGPTDFERPLGGGMPTAFIRHYRDDAAYAAGLAPGDLVGWGLVLRKTDPGAVEPVTMELPGVWLDAVIDDDPGPLWVANRIPEPNFTAVPHSWATVQMELHSVSLEAVNLATLAVSVGGQQAIVGGVVQPPFSGSIVLDAPLVLIELDISSLTPVSSGVVEVTLSAQTVGALDSVNAGWSWVWSDTIAPTLVKVGEAYPRVLWVWANEALASVPGSGFALQPLDPPGYVPEVLDVQLLEGELFALTLDGMLTQSIPYRLTGTVTDVEGNDGVVSIDFASGRFRPSNRVVDVFRWFSRYNRTTDEGALLFLCKLLQDAFEDTLVRTDRFLRIFDPDRCEEWFLPALLEAHASPWAAELMTTEQQRRAVEWMVSILQLKGTKPGMVLAAQVLLDLTITVVTGTGSTWWQIGFNQLGVDTIIAPDPGAPVWYTFWFDLPNPENLTQYQLEWLDRIANTLRGAHEHYGGIYTLSVPSQEFWLLGLDQLGVDTIIGV